MMSKHVSPTAESTDAPLFRPLTSLARPIRVVVDGAEIAAQAGETVAALLLRISAPDNYRISAVTDLPRAPLCMMGVCFECLIEIDGQSNQQGCLIQLREDMQIRRQQRPVQA